MRSTAADAAAVDEFVVVAAADIEDFAGAVAVDAAVVNDVGAVGAVGQQPSSPLVPLWWVFAAQLAPMHSETPKMLTCPKKVGWRWTCLTVWKRWKRTLKRERKHKRTQQQQSGLVA